MKYKVGDRVIRTHRIDRGEIIGAQGTIIKYQNDGCFCVEFDKFIRGHSCAGEGKDGHCWWVGSNNVRRIGDKKIVITTDGTETLARLYEGNKVVKSATAKCSPEDEFDFNTGARLAFDRLFEATTEKKEEYYNGKVVCVADYYTDFTVGKVYTFVNGQTKDDSGTARPVCRCIKKLEDYSGFIPFVE